MPYSLAGNLTVRDSSCQKCQEIINQFENDCSAHMLKSLRIKHSFPSRKRKSQLSLLPLPISQGEGSNFAIVNWKDVEIEYVPTVIALPTLSAPELLSGLANPWSGTFWVYCNTREIDLFEFQYGGYDEARIEMGRSRPDAWFRLLAKIAHGYATVSADYNFRPILPPIILGECTNYGKFIGCAPIKSIPPLSDQSVFALRFGYFPNYQDRYVVVSVRLLGYLGAPEYIVVAGECETQ